MIIKKIRLQNWRSHKDTVLEFSKGTNILVGIMGSGKSSVLEAVCFALYGTFPALARRRVKLGQIVSNLEGANTALVEVVIEKDGKEYTFRRTIKEGKSDAELRENGRLVEVKSDAVTRMTEHILGIDYDLFTKAIYAEQNSIDYFLSLNPIERKRQIDELIGIDRFEVARANALRLSNRLAKEVEEKEKLLATQNKTQLLSEKNDAESKLKDALEERGVLKGEIERTLQEYLRIKREYEALERNKKRYEELTRREVEGVTFVDSMSVRIKGYTQEQLENELNAIKQLEKETEELKRKRVSLENEIANVNRIVGEIKGIVKMRDAKQNEAKELRERILLINEPENFDEVKRRYDELNDEVQSLEKELSARKKERELIEKEYIKLKGDAEKGSLLESELADLKKYTQRTLDEKRQLVENLLSWAASLREIIKISEEYIQQLSAEGGSVCPLCESPLDPKKKQQIIASKQERIDNSKKELENCTRSIEELQSEIKEIELKLQKKNEIEKSLKDIALIKEELSKKKVLLDNLNEDIGKYERKLGELNEKRVEMDLRVKKAEEVRNLKNRLEEIERFLNENKDVEKKIDEANERYKTLENELKGYDEKLSEKEKLLVSTRNKLREIEEDITLQKQVDERRRIVEQVRDELKKLNYNEELLKSYAESLNSTGLKMKELEVRLENVESNLPMYEKNVELLSKRIEEIERLENEIKLLNATIKNLSVFQDAIVETQVTLRSELVNSINTTMEKIWKVLYPYGDLERVKLEATESDYVLMAYRRSEWIPVEGNVSGGERASAALALRVALSIVLAPHMSMLIMDEPTHNLDENGVRSLSDILRERLPKIINQTFVITHDENLKEGASGTLYVFHRDKKSYAPTEVLMDKN